MTLDRLTHQLGLALARAVNDFEKESGNTITALSITRGGDGSHDVSVVVEETTVH